MSETRRSVLSLSLGSVAALGLGLAGFGLIRACAPDVRDPDRSVDLSDLARGTWRAFTLNDKPLSVFNGPDGFRAFYLSCTRAGCALELSPDESTWVCPCDDARFALDGEALSGPAPRDLDRVPVQFSGDVMQVPRALGALESAI